MNKPTIKAGDIVKFSGMKGQVYKFFEDSRTGERVAKVAVFKKDREWPVNRFPLWPVDKLTRVETGKLIKLGAIDRGLDDDREVQGGADPLDIEG
jgi:hypothetical protein